MPPRDLRQRSGSRELSEIRHSFCCFICSATSLHVFPHVKACAFREKDIRRGTLVLEDYNRKVDRKHLWVKNSRTNWFDVMAQARRESRWWLEAGTETCPACNHTYAYRTEHYCVDCDGPVCGLCVETVTTESLCPDCFGSRNSESEVSS